MKDYLYPPQIVEDRKQVKIYVASSWRNDFQPTVVKSLRQQGFEVYDFKNPAPENNGFRWLDIDPDSANWTPLSFVNGLKHPIAVEGFNLDMEALRICDLCVLVLPSGRSAHIEAGWAIGAGKPTCILLDEKGFEPELMYLMASLVTPFWYDVEQWCESQRNSLLSRVPDSTSLTDQKPVYMQSFIATRADWEKLYKALPDHGDGEIVLEILDRCNGIDFDAPVSIDCKMEHLDELIAASIKSNISLTYGVIRRLICDCGKVGCCLVVEAQIPPQGKGRAETHPFDEPCYFGEDGEQIAVRGDISREDAAARIKALWLKDTEEHLKFEPNELLEGRVSQSPDGPDSDEWILRRSTAPMPPTATNIFDVWYFDNW